MKKIYITGVALSVLFFLSCSKDFLKSYEKRIVGTWTITGVNRVGLGGNTDNLSFKQGTFTFNEDGNMTYSDLFGDIYNGSWNIRKKWIDDKPVQSLQITAVNFVTQKVLTEFYDDLNFTGTNHFKANITSGFHTYVTHFKR